MKKIAVVTYAKLHGLNGLSFYVNNFQENADFFANHGLHVRVFTDDFSEGFKEAEQAIQDELQYVKGPVFKVKQYLLRLLSRSEAGSRFIFKKAFMEKAKRVIQRNCEELSQADVIIVNDFLCGYFVIEEHFDAKIIYVMHNDGKLYSQLFSQFPNMTKGKLGIFLCEVEKKIFNSADVIAFVSETARATFISTHNAHEGKCMYIPVGREDIQCVYEHDYNESIKIACAGTVSERKNQMGLIRAFERIPHENVSLMIIGGGPQLEECEEYVSNHAIKNVQFTGSTNDIPSYLDKANLFVSPSLNEGLPATGVEALRSGLPIIVGDVGGCKELIDGNGLLVDPSNLDELVEAMCYMINNPRMLERMSKQSRLLFQTRYSLEHMFNIYINIIDDLLITR